MPSTRKHVLVTGGVLGAIAAVMVALLGINRLVTEYLWFSSLGQQQVLVERIGSQFVVWAAAALVAFVVFRSTARLAEKITQAPAFVSKVITWATAVLAALMGLTLSSHWMTLRLAWERVSFGLTDPQFGKDVSFFVLALPALERISTWINGLVVLAILTCIAIVFLPEQLGASEGVKGRWAQLKPIVMVLTGFLMLYSAFNYWLAIWQLNLSSSAQVTGAAYTDVHARIPAFTWLAVISTLVAVVLFATARSARWRVPIVALTLWAVMAIALGSVWPALMQRYIVAPNEASLELPYIERNIAMTRQAFQLDAMHEYDYPATKTLSEDASLRAADALEDTRVWDSDTVEQSFTQLQTIRPYFRLSAIDTDRYVVSGRLHQVLASARLIDSTGLPDAARTWVNEHLVYTHGYGMAISSASDATVRGFPRFLVGDVPPVVDTDVAAESPGLEATQPRVYFGPDMDDYALVRTGIDEFDYALGGESVMCRYEADAGVRVGSGLSRLAWALRLQSEQILFSDYVQDDSRILMHRDIYERCRKIAPWLEFDETPYAAIVDGRITWILDAYTSSDHYPYSEPIADGTNYLRNSVKVAVDALTGATTFYAFGDDPVRDAWASIFPSVVTPTDEVPATLAAHFRYPERLFSTQAKVLRTYHMTDPTVFYNKEDEWEIAGESAGDALAPAYVMIDLPDSAPGSGLHLMVPYSPAGSDNLVAWVAVGCDPEDYGEQTVYLLPRDRIVLGAEQTRARINQDPTISPQLSLWQQRGSTLLFGEMLILPIEGGITYVQPLFLQAEGRSITELASVVVASEDEMAMDATLSGAVAGVYGGADSAMVDTKAARVGTLLREVETEMARGNETAYRAKLEELRSFLESLVADVDRGKPAP